MTKPYDALGELKRIDLREVWQNEASDFTPWLAREENLALLGKSLGLELELQGTEQNVGPFKADILCKYSYSDTLVLIENQIEDADHRHLGQLLTYAAGLRAVTVVWIAAAFTDEHRAALDWLNEITNEKINFFGLEIELWKIGNSDMAPKFNVVSKPNGWSKSVASEGPLTQKQLLQRDFWFAFAEYIRSKKTSIRPGTARPQNWMSLPLGRTGTELTAIASFYDSQAETFANHEVRAEVTLYDRNAKCYYDQLFAQKGAIEKELGEPLTWDKKPDKVRSCRIFLRKPTNIEDSNNWPEQQKWLLEKLEALDKVFRPRVKALQAREDEEPGYLGIDSQRAE